MKAAKRVVVLALGWSGAAWAQTVPNGDMELLDVDWVESSVECSDPLDGLPPFCDETTGSFAWDSTYARGAWAGWLWGFEGYGYWIEAAATSAPFVVTHATLGWAVAGPADVEVLSPAWTGSSPVLGPPSADSFTNWEMDISSVCGAETQVRIHTTQWDVWFDDFALGGAVCADFLDGDGDGACPQGIDLDGDGSCVGAGEPTFGTSSDCDDADAAVGACMVVAHEPWAAAGSDFVATVTGVPPGETVHLIASEAEGAACPAILGGACLELADPLIDLGSAVADAGGTAEIVVPLRMRMDPYQRWHLQASTLTATRSEPSEVWILPPAYGPPAVDGGVFNGDMEDWSVGWPPDSKTYADNWYSYACPSPTYTTVTARGTRALQLGDSFTYRCDGEVIGWPFLVTHRTLSWASQGPLEVDLHDGADDSLVPSTIAGPVLADDEFEEWAADLQAGCGEVRYLRVRSGSDGANPVLDDVRLSGSVCAIYVDRDGDGACPSGVDLDGDGFCVSEGEPDGPVYGTELPLEVVLLDFEPPVTSEVVTAAEVEPITTLGAQSGEITPDLWHIWSLDVVVTHEHLAFQATSRGLGDWVPARLDVEVRDSGSYTVLAGLTVDMLGGPGDWSQHLVDTSAMCGDVAEDLWLTQLYTHDDWHLTDDWYTYAHADDILVDEVGFAGAPCAIFVDGDGDGLCSEGIDGDGDGLCVGAGEPTPGTVQDVDDPSVAP